MNCPRCGVEDGVLELSRSYYDIRKPSIEVFCRSCKFQGKVD